MKKLICSLSHNRKVARLTMNSPENLNAMDDAMAGRGVLRVLVAFDPELGDWVKKDRAHYARVRANGYEALVGDRHSEIAGISAPVFRKDGALAAALTLTMPAHRYDERYIRNVLEAARALGAQLP